MSRPVPPADPLPSLEADTAAALLDAATLLVVVLDASGRVERFNAACEQATGYRAEEIVGGSIWRLIPEEQRPGLEAVLTELRDTGRSSLHENDWLGRDGERRRIAWSNTAVHAPDGALARVIGTGIDVTELRASQVRHRESESRLAGIVVSAMDAIVSVSEEQKILLFNPAAERMFGYRAHEVIGRPLDLLMPERFRGAHRDHVERFGRSGATSRRMGQLGRVWARRSGGEEFPVEASISQTRHQDSVLMTVILRDITDRERAAETARLLASIVASSNDAIVGTDGDGRILTWNPAAREIYGYEADEVHGRRVAMLAPAETQAELERALEAVREGRVVGDLSTVGVTRGGKRFAVSIGVSPRRDGSGALVGASLVARDVQERHELEQRLRQTEELAAVATLVTGIAHDIGTPMNVILGYTDLLARSATSDKDRERIRIIKDQVERVTRLTQALMNFARPQRETARAVRIEDVAERALGLIAETTRRRGIEVVRAFRQTPTIVVQAERLERAFLDLYVNACDAMPGGGELRVETRSYGDGVEVRIADTGTGIAPDALARIFEPFYTTKPRGQGTGLGLLVTRSIVLDHGGQIDVDSTPGEGTAFRIRLPLEPPAKDGRGGSER